MANRGARVSIIELAPVYSALSSVQSGFAGIVGAFQSTAFQNNAFWIGFVDSGTARVSLIEVRPVYANLAFEES